VGTKHTKSITDRDYTAQMMLQRYYIHKSMPLSYGDLEYKNLLWKNMFCLFGWV